MKKLLLPICMLLLLIACSKQETEKKSQEGLSPDSARVIAKEAWIYGYSIFWNYKAQYLIAIDSTYSDYAGGFNKFKQYSSSFTYKDTSVVTPNNDTPYSWAILNLSDEPCVLEVPAIEANRYYVMQLVDLYTFNFAYVGTRALGNKAGKYLIAGPEWNGEKPAGIDEVIKSETNLVTILGRTEIKSNADVANVKKIQAKYKLLPLHEYEKKEAPATKQYALPLPEWKASGYQSFGVIDYLNPLLQYASVDPSEEKLRARFASIGIEAGKKFDQSRYSKEVLAAIEEGFQDGDKALKEAISKTTGSRDLFGTREEMHNDYLKRATAAAMGLYGNTKEEAVYVGSQLDNKGEQLLGTNKYVLRFPKGKLPEVKYFWSITLYSLPNRFLVKNPIERYSIGNRDKLKYENNGDLLIYLQATSPGKDKESNWLPTPVNGPYNYVLRLYGPDKAVIDGTWEQPLPEKVK